MARAALARTLITFDIDGTLIRALGAETNKLHKRAFSHAFATLFGVQGTIDAIDHHGSTDPLVCFATLQHYGVPREVSEPRLLEIKAKMLEYAQAHRALAAEGLSVLPGVVALLQDLSARHNVLTGLVTGNLADIAWLKMEALGLKPYFTHPNFGGFGSDHVERAELVRIAAQKAADLFPSAQICKRIHVGDTPADLRAAKDGGAYAVGVCTGAFTRDQLLPYTLNTTVGAIVLDDLEDKSKFLRACDLSDSA
eukprot:SM000147S01135  [mRNA]  locus=s147:344257:346298:- [translate_table: standard]